MRTLLIVSALLFAGCTPCKDACRVESRQFEDCLGAWDMEWIDLGATDRTSYRRECVANVDVWLDGLPEDEQISERQACQGLVNQLRGETDCDAAWEALTNYGAL